MAQSICQCHCGTRIDLDEQLLEQREMWKQKYLCLQKQIQVDIQSLKENIYAECANIMQQQFSEREGSHNTIVNKKNEEIKDLISRAINLQTQVKVLTKQKQLIEHRINEIQSQLNQKDELINLLKSKSAKSIREWQLKHDEEIVNLKKRMSADNKQEIDKINVDREHLRHKVKEFQQKYQKLIPEVEKMRNLLAQKTNQCDELLSNIEKINSSHMETVSSMKRDYEGLQKIHSNCSRHVKDLEQKNQDLMSELERCKKLSREIRVEPVYIDRPVEVVKIVEKVVQVERVVKKFIDNPNNPRVSELEEDNKKLKEELNNILKEIRDIEDHYSHVVAELQGNIKAHEDNTIQYKKERENLAHRISEQNKELELLQNFIDKLGAQKGSNSNHDSEKIIVHVKQDGTYQKTVQKLPAQPASKRKK